MKIFCSATRILLLVICAAVQVMSQIPTRMGPASADEIKKALSVLEANMDSYEAHRAYIFAMGMKNPDVFTQYEKWIKKYPKNINIPLSIGTAYSRAAMPGAQDFLLRAADMDPKNAKVWVMLSNNAFTMGNSDLSLEYLKKAALLEPLNSGHAYAIDVQPFENGDADLYREKVFAFAKRFPTDQVCAQAIYWLAVRTGDMSKRIQYLEELRRLYPPKDYRWSASGMTTLSEAYLQTDIGKVSALSSEMGGEAEWKVRKQVADLFIEINKLEQDQNFKDAITKLDNLKLTESKSINDFVALKKASFREKTGDVKGAYDSLSIRFAKLPTDALHSAIESYGTKLGKSKEQIRKDIEVIREGRTTAAYPFKLGLYTSNDTLDLSSLKGKVVLLTFWFPTCGPCLEEFPHFQTVVDSFKGDSLVYIGINVTPSQDGYVLPFLQNRKFSFIPLRGSWDFARENFGVSGAPANFVIDKDGKVVFKNFTIGSANHRTLELMLSSLLAKRGSGE